MWQKQRHFALSFTLKTGGTHNTIESHSYQITQAQRELKLGYDIFLKDCLKEISVVDLVTLVGSVSLSNGPEY